MQPPTWDDRYGTEDYAYGIEPNDFLAARADRIAPGGHVLSLGEGEGRNAVFLARRGLRVTGIDGSVVGLAKAQRLAARFGVQIATVHGDLASAPLPTDVDAVVSIFCHLPSTLRRMVHRRAESALRTGGVVIIEVYRPEQLAFGTGGPPVVDLLATLADLREDFSSCVMEEGAEIIRDVVEGRMHTGKAAVVQVVLRKTASTGH